MSILEEINLYNALDFLPEGYFIIDKEFNVLYWNKSLEILTEVDREQILKTKLEETFPNFGKEIYRRRIEPVLNGGPPVVFSAKLHKDLFSRKDSQSNYFFQVTISSLRVSNEVNHALISVENRNEIYSQINELINQRKEALNEMNKKEEVNSLLVSKHIEIQEAFATLSETNMQVEKQRQKLLELNATKDKFFSIIAHDLINPFSFLMGFTNLINEKFDSYTPMELKEMIGHLNETAVQTYDLLQNLLQWSRAQSRRLENNPIQIQVDKIIENNIKLLKNNSEEKGIQIDSNISNDAEILADYNMINTVFRNLISNAIKFTKQDGSISLFIDTIDDDFITIVVKDSGVGISDDRIEKLFKIEENVSTFGTNKEKGTGLGLLLCKEFIEIMGGSIWVESKVDEGSQFYVKIPKWKQN